MDVPGPCARRWLSATLTGAYQLQAGDVAEVRVGTWVPCVVKICLTAGNLIVRPLLRTTLMRDSLIVQVGGPGYYVEYRTQNGDLICHPVRKEYVRKAGSA